MSIRVKSLLALTGNIRLVVKFLKVTIVKLSNRGDFLVSVDVYCQILIINKRVPTGFIMERKKRNGGKVP